jgi:hypothetical protein
MLPVGSLNLRINLAALESMCLHFRASRLTFTFLAAKYLFGQHQREAQGDFPLSHASSIPIGSMGALAGDDGGL